MSINTAITQMHQIKALGQTLLAIKIIICTPLGALMPLRRHHHLRPSADMRHESIARLQRNYFS
jgi:hypothetical protein